MLACLKHPRVCGKNWLHLQSGLNGCARVRVCVRVCACMCACVWEIIARTTFSQRWFDTSLFQCKASVKHGQVTDPNYWRAVVDSMRRKARKVTGICQTFSLKSLVLQPKLEKRSRQVHMFVCLCAASLVIGSSASPS